MHITMSVPYDMLLHPELLSNEQLIYIIQERHLKVPSIEEMPRDQLLEIFHHYCVPYGQRRYRDSGRGKVLNKNRPVSPECKTKLNTVVTNTQSRKLNICSDRLKPPPDILSGHMKRIKLDTSVSVFTDENTYKRKINGDSSHIVTDCTPPKKERKSITWP